VGISRASEDESTQIFSAFVKLVLKVKPGDEIQVFDAHSLTRVASLAQLPQFAPEKIFFGLGIGVSVSPARLRHTKVDVVKTKSLIGVW
jgi:hypothetical protein